MGYNTPSDLVDGNDLDASWLMAYVRDNWNALAGARSQYTPVLTAAGGGIVLGTGAVQEGQYLLLGKWCVAQIGVQWGSSGNTFSTGTYSITLPPGAIPRTSAMSLSPIGRGFVYDVSATTPLSVEALRDTTTTFTMRNVGLTSFVTATTPMTFANSDGFYITLNYELA